MPQDPALVVQEVKSFCASNVAIVRRLLLEFGSFKNMVVLKLLDESVPILSKKGYVVDQPVKALAWSELSPFLVELVASQDREYLPLFTDYLMAELHVRNEAGFRERYLVQIEQVFYEKLFAATEYREIETLFSQLVHFCQYTGRYKNVLVIVDALIKKWTVGEFFNAKLGVHVRLLIAKNARDQKEEDISLRKMYELDEFHKEKAKAQVAQQGNTAFEQLIPFLCEIQTSQNKQVIVEFMHSAGYPQFKLSDLDGAYVVPPNVPKDKQRQWLFQERHRLESIYGVGIFPVTIMLKDMPQILEDFACSGAIIPRTNSAYKRNPITVLFAQVGGMRFIEHGESRDAHEDVHAQYSLGGHYFEFSRLVDEIIALYESVRANVFSYEHVRDFCLERYLKQYYPEVSGADGRRVLEKLKSAWRAVFNLASHFPPGRMIELLHQARSLDDVAKYASFSLSQFQALGGYTPAQFEQRALRALAEQLDAEDPVAMDAESLLTGECTDYYLGNVPEYVREEIREINSAISFIAERMSSDFYAQVRYLLAHYNTFREVIEAVRAAQVSLGNRKS